MSDYTVKQIMCRPLDTPVEGISQVFFEECRVHFFDNGKHWGLASYMPIVSIKLGVYDTVAHSQILNALIKEINRRYPWNVPSPPLTEQDIKLIEGAVREGKWDE